MGKRGPKTKVDIEEALRLAEKGWSNRMIGDRLGTSGQNIGKLLKPYFPEGRTRWVPPGTQVKKNVETVSFPRPETVSEEGGETVSPPSKPAPKQAPADKKGGGNTTPSLELNPSPELVDMVTGIVLGLVERRFEVLEAGQAPVDQPSFTDAVDIIKEMFAYLGPEDTSTELGDIARQTVFGWYDRNRIPGWLHDIRWE